MSEKHSEPGNPLDAERLATADARSKARQEQTKASNALHAKRLREWREAWERLEEASQSAKVSNAVWQRLGGVLRDQGYQRHAARVRARLTAWLEAVEGNGEAYKCPLTSVTGLRTHDPEGYRQRIEAYAVMATIVHWAAEGDTDRLEAMPESYQRRVTPETVARVRQEIEHGSDRPVEAEASDLEAGDTCKPKNRPSAPQTSPAAKSEASDSGQRQGKRRGRLAKAESREKQTQMLAILTAHPTMLDDVPALAEKLAVSESTARRWRDELAQRQTQTRERYERDEDTD